MMYYRFHNQTPAALVISAVLILAPVYHSSAVHEWHSDGSTSMGDGTPRAEESDTEHIASVLDQDTPEVWATVNSFSRHPTIGNTAGAFVILDDVLVVWSSHPPGVVTTILESIAEHRVEAGRRYLSLFAHVDPQQPSAIYIIRSAARALGKIGGEGALEELVSLAKGGPTSAAATVAVALGFIGDSRAVPTLELLAQHPELRVRSRALSALAEYCAETSFEVVVDNLNHSDKDVRNSAAWWLANCGKLEHSSYLVTLLDDADTLVCGNALKGLLRLNSKNGCGKIKELLDSDSHTVVDLARDYEKLCGTP